MCGSCHYRLNELDWFEKYLWEPWLLCLSSRSLHLQSLNTIILWCKFNIFFFNLISVIASDVFLHHTKDLWEWKIIAFYYAENVRWHCRHQDNWSGRAQVNLWSHKTIISHGWAINCVLWPRVVNLLWVYWIFCLGTMFYLKHEPDNHLMYLQLLPVLFYNTNYAALQHINIPFITPLW